MDRSFGDSVAVVLPDNQRRFAELLVDGGFVSRRGVEQALRAARRGGESLMKALNASGHIRSYHLPAIQRLEALLPAHPSVFHVAALLKRSGDLSASELREILETRQATGQSLADLLTSRGYPNAAAARPIAVRRTTFPSLASAAACAAVAFGMVIMTSTPAGNASATSTLVAAAASSAARVLDSAPAEHGPDLRFASLGDIAKHPMIERERRRITRLRTTVPDDLRIEEPIETPESLKDYAPMIDLYTAEYKLPAGLLYAMIETESSFNARARSGDNAVGLMQLVPHTGGRDAYRRIKGRHGTPSVAALMNPKTNVKFGAAYMRVLLDHYFDDIRNREVRLAVAMAAYNWGPARVRAVIKTEGKPKSVREFQYQLDKHAPAETRAYVRLVSRRMDFYDDFSRG